MSKPPKSDLFYQRAFYGLLLLHGVLWFSLGMLLDLHPDEADHWVWSRFLSWGYYEHPPMVAWAIRFFTTLFGQNQWALEIGSQVLTLLSFGIIFLMARDLFGTAAAFWSVLALELTPLFVVGSIIFTIDTVLVFFYLGLAYFFWKGYREKKTGSWYLAGAALGLALLSKVTALLLLLSFFLFLVLEKSRRKSFLNPHLILALFLGFVIFSPFIFWNLNHDWISLKSQLEKGLTGGRDWNQALGFWLGQPLILGPVLFLFFAISLFWALKKFRHQEELAFVTLLTLVPLAVFGLAALRGKYTDPSWTIIGWPFGAVLLGGYWTEKLSRFSLKKSLAVAFLIFLTSWVPLGAASIHAFYPFLPIPTDNDRTLEMRGWRHLGREMGKIYQKTFPQTQRVYLLTDEYQLAGAISFYTPQHPVPYTFAKSQRNFWITLPALEKAGALLVCRDQTCPQDREKARGLFKHVEPVAEIPLFRQGKMVKYFKVYYCSN
jgi:4-amino-4-deoxy-L-arabinose transferase-like glycosyltransferase